MKLQLLRRRIPGVYDGDDVRTERTPRGWVTEVRCREIGATGYYEFHRHGHWIKVGVFPTLADAEKARNLLHSGIYVMRPGYYNSVLGDVPETLWPWTAVKDEIASHPSVTGDAVP